MESKTTVVNLKTHEFDVYIGRNGYGRDGYFGNPIKLGHGDARGATLERYKAYFYARLNSDVEFLNRVNALKGKRLGCWCKPHPCHGDIIAEYLNNK